MMADELGPPVSGWRLQSMRQLALQYTAARKEAIQATTRLAVTMAMVLIASLLARYWWPLDLVGLLAVWAAYRLAMRASGWQATADYRMGQMIPTATVTVSIEPTASTAEPAGPRPDPAQPTD